MITDFEREIARRVLVLKPEETYYPVTNSFDTLTMKWHEMVVKTASLFREYDHRFDTLQFFRVCGALKG